MQRFIKPEELERQAQRFLEKHHSSQAVPVPIEEIVEFKLRLRIIPFPDLEKTFGVDGFLTFRPDTIYVDETQMVRQPDRYRYTLAHEVRHLLLHRAIYEESGVATLQAYLDFQDQLDDSLRDAYEFQARNLGGRILVPQARLFDLVEKALPSAKRGLPKDSHQNTRLVCGWLARHLASAFEVTHAVIETRLIGDGLCGHFGLSRPPRASR